MIAAPRHVRFPAQRGKRQGRLPLERLVAAITIGWVLGPLAAAQQIAPAALGAEHDWRQPAADMRAVAKGLPPAAPAAAPGVALVLSEFYFDRLLPSHHRIGHDVPSINGVRLD